MSERNPLLWLLFVFALLAFGARSIADLATDWLWFEAVGQSDTFVTMIATRIEVALVTAMFVATSVWFAGRRALHLTSKTAPGRPPLRVAGNPWLDDPTSLERLIRAASGAAALLMGMVGASEWDTVLSFLHRIPFGFEDPILGNDASVYVFVLPLLQFVQATAMFTTLAAGGVALFVYFIRGAFVVVVDNQEDRATLKVDPEIRRHLASLTILLMLVVAVGFHLDRYSVMTMTGDTFDGPGYTAVNAILPILGVQALATAVAGYFLFQGISQARSGWVVLGTLLSAGSFFVRALAPGMVQQLIVTPNELERERVYLAEHVHATRRAWGLDAVEERTLSGQAQLSWNDIENNVPTLRNVRLWDHVPLLQTFKQLQEIRTYYSFVGVDNDRYRIDGELRQTMLSPRELDPNQLDEQAQTWVNKKLVYTHGYGVALGPVNEVTPEGLPLLWVKDLPPAIEHPDPLRIDKAGLYYGESMPDGVFVRTSAEEFDHPTSESNAYAVYDGTGGVQVANFMRRILLALRLGSTEVLLSNDLNEGSRALLYRSVRDRVRRIAPFLLVDEDPYLIIADGRLVWVLDAYTHTDDYPYAKHVDVVDPDGRVRATFREERMADGSVRTRVDKVIPATIPVNYMRNSVKATVDAYDGTVHLYAMEPTDPILQVWMRSMPNLFDSADTIPDSVRSHLRVPVTLFGLLAELFADYHMTDSQDFYNREDAWEVPRMEATGTIKPRLGSNGRMEPYYTVMKLPGEDTEEFILMLPFTPREKQNLAAWMVARTDGENYGTLRVYRFPKDRLVYGPSQIAQRITQDAEISQRLTLWGQQQSEVQLGTLLVIPIEESLLYVQPLYLQANSDAIPELKRVIVAYENQITMAPTLDEAVRDLFSAEERRPPEQPAQELSDGATDWAGLSRQAQQQYDAALSASREGRWGEFGDALDALGRTLGDLQSLAPAEEASELQPFEDAPSE